MYYPTTTVPNAGGGTYVNSLVVSTKPCVLLGIIVYNSLAGAQFLQLHESATLPADTAVPKAIFALGSAAGQVIMLPPGGMQLTSLVICNSTTGPTKTIGLANCSIVAILKG